MVSIMQHAEHHALSPLIVASLKHIWSLLCNMRNTMLPPIQLSLNGRNLVFMLFVFQFARAANVW